MVENDIIDPTDRSRLPPITTKVTPERHHPEDRRGADHAEDVVDVHEPLVRQRESRS